MGSLEFCEAIQPLLLKLHSSVKIGFMDDLTLSGDLHTVERDITTIMESSSETGLQLNVDKCEISKTISQKSTHLPRSMILSVSTRRT